MSYTTFLFVKTAKNIGSFFWKKGDLGTIDRFGPDGISRLIKTFLIKLPDFRQDLYMIMLLLC